jgi:hypothetical protein
MTRFKTPDKAAEAFPGRPRAGTPPESSETPWNPGIQLDVSWVRRAAANRSAIERRAASLGARRSVKKAWQAAWLLRAVSCMDLTTLSAVRSDRMCWPRWGCRRSPSMWLPCVCITGT